MDEGTEGFEKEVGEIKTLKIEVMDTRVTEKGTEQERLNADQINKLNERIKTDKIQENLAEYENFLGPYTKHKVSEEFKVNVRYGKNIGGEVRDGVLSVDMLSPQEFQAFDKLVETGKKIDEETDEIKYFFDILNAVGTTYSEVALGSMASTVMHESEHMIIDSQPGSQLDKGFKQATDIKNDEGGHTLSLLDEGLTYAFQFAKDDENDLNKRLFKEKQKLITEGKFSPERKGYLADSRERLGEVLRPKMEEYLKDGKQIDKEFLEFAGAQMKNKEIVDVEKYLVVSKLERSLRGVDCRTEQWNNFESREFDNPTEILEKLVIEGYCFHGSSRKVDGDIEPQQANDLIKESGNENAVYMTINPLLAEFTGLYGGAEGVIKRENSCHMEINDGKISYSGESRFAVNDPDKGAKEGYVYVFDRKTSGFEEINGEILSKRKIEPLMVIKIKREDFIPEVKMID